jgi:hypothetical protein
LSIDHVDMNPHDEEQGMPETRSASRRITDEVTSWPGVTAGQGRRGAHLGFPKDVWRHLYDEGRVDYHPVFPGKPGPASRRLENDDDVRDVIAMIRMNYDRIVERFGLPARRDEEPVGSA